jgi:hypothetical protein
MLWLQNFKKYNLLCWYEGDFCLGGLVVCRWEELGLERRRRNRGGEGRQSWHILTFFDGFTDGFFVGDSDGKIDTSPYGSAISNPSVIPSVI